MKAISVLSGGLDSTVATSVYKEEYDIHGITFNYGQKSFNEELKAARKICDEMNMTHEVINLDWLNNISNSTLNTGEIPEVNESDLDNIEKCEETSKSVWVPARNLVFTSIATAYAESIDASIIIVGWDREEAETFPDNSKEFLRNINKTIAAGSPKNIEIKAPLIDLDKEEIVKLGDKLNAPMSLSYSCYSGGANHCGVCESCVRRKRAFKKAGVQDLTEYI